ncbi:MAG: aminoglycoside 6-adenylyltransferase [Hyphomicrobiales bacterium]
MDVVSHIVSALPVTSPLKTLFLSGSRGRGTEDEYSDFDFVAVCEESQNESVAHDWHAILEELEPLIYWQKLGKSSMLINAITKSWIRIDLSMVSSLDKSRFTQDTLVAVLDPDDQLASLPKKSKRQKTKPDAVLAIVNEFIRIMGLTGIVMGRREYLVGVWGVQHLRNQLVALMLEEVNPTHRGGALHLNTFLTDEQRFALGALPSAVATRNSIIQTNMAYAKVFLPRARALVDLVGAKWPEEFERETWAYLTRALEIDVSSQLAIAER